MMQKKLLLFSYDFPPSNGGIARLCQEISSGMDTYYSEILIITKKKSGPSLPYNKNNLKIVELPSKRFFCEIASFIYLLKIKNKKSYDVLCGIWHPEGFLSLATGFKNIYILGHGTEFLSGASRFRKRFWLPVYAKLVLTNVKKVIANSNYTKGLVNKISKDIKCDTLTLAVNATFFRQQMELRQNRDKINICSVSRIEKFKGHDFIAKTIASLPIQYRNKIHWNIAGTGPFLIELKEIIVDLNLNDLVTFHGFIPDIELPKFYNQNDVFILCSREEPNSTSVEGFGLVFLEAQSCGVPCIAVNSGGISDAVENKNGGWLITQDDEMVLSSIFKEIIDDPSIIINQGELARNRILKGYTWLLYNEKLKALLS